MIAVFTHSPGTWDGHRLDRGLVLPVNPAQAARLNLRVTPDVHVYAQADRVLVQVAFDTVKSAPVIVGSVLASEPGRPGPRDLGIPGLELVGHIDVIERPAANEPVMLRLSDVRKGSTGNAARLPELELNEPAAEEPADDGLGEFGGGVRCPFCPRLMPTRGSLDRHVEFAHAPEHEKHQDEGAETPPSALSP